MLDKIDLKVIDILQKETKTLTLQEIASKTGEADFALLILAVNEQSG